MSFPDLGRSVRPLCTNVEEFCKKGEGGSLGGPRASGRGFASSVYLDTVFISPVLCSGSNGHAIASVRGGDRLLTEVFAMAISESVRPITATQTVSKAEVFRFLESQFARADRNRDGLLDIDELALFVQYVSHPQSNQR
jgi:hypothetical protein